MLLRLPDRAYFGGLAVLCLLMVALAVVWPQGEGARSPAPFGHAEITPDYVKVDARKARARLEAEAAIKAAQARASGGIQAPEARSTEPAR